MLTPGGLPVPERRLTRRVRNYRTTGLICAYTHSAQPSLCNATCIGSCGADWRRPGRRITVWRTIRIIRRHVVGRRRRIGIARRARGVGVDFRWHRRMQMQTRHATRARHSHRGLRDVHACQSQQACHRLHSPRMRARAVWNSYCSTTACASRHRGDTCRDITLDMTH